MSDPIRLAFIGTGLIVAAKHWPALRQLRETFQVAALANRSPAKAELLAGEILADTGTRPAVYSDYREMLAAERLEAVSLALPTHMNPEVAQAAMASGCHVLAEKPIAASLNAARSMLPWSARYGRTLMIAENYRYMASYRRAAAMIADGAIGKVHVARWSLYPHMTPDKPYYHTAWRRQPAHPGGYISDGGVHHAAVLRMLLGEAAAVSAQAAALRADLPPVDTVSASLRFAGGAIATYAVTYAVAGPETPLHVVGSEGTLLIWRDRIDMWQRGQVADTWPEPSIADGLCSMYEDFARAVRTGQPPRSTADEGYADLQLIVALLRSAEEGREIQLGKVE